MANTNKCGDCTEYHAIIKPHRSGGKSTNTRKGHCLDQTIYAGNKPGNPVYPPGAKVQELPYGRHKIVLRREDEVCKHCMAFKPRGGK